jgi:hypothetical protein
MTITLTTRERAILDHRKLEGADAWLASLVGLDMSEAEAKEQLNTIVARHTAEYDKNKDRVDYENRAARQVTKDVKFNAVVEVDNQKRLDIAADEKATMDDRIAAEVSKQLAAR